MSNYVHDAIIVTPFFLCLRNDPVESSLEEVEDVLLILNVGTQQSVHELRHGGELLHIHHFIIVLVGGDID